MGVGFCQRLFLHMSKDHMVLIIQFVTVVYHTDCFVDLEEPLHPLDKSHLIMMYNLFNGLLDAVC